MILLVLIPMRMCNVYVMDVYVMDVYVMYENYLYFIVAPTQPTYTLKIEPSIIRTLSFL